MKTRGREEKTSCGGHRRTEGGCEDRERAGSRPIEGYLGACKRTDDNDARSEAGQRKVRAIAAFYPELVAAGMSDDTAMKMTEQQFANPVALVLGKLGERRKFSIIEKE